MIAAPPLFVGGLQRIVAFPAPPLADTLVGTPGVVAGVTAPAVATVPAPIALTARTLSVTAVPFVRFGNVYERALAATSIQAKLPRLT